MVVLSPLQKPHFRHLETPICSNYSVQGQTKLQKQNNYWHCFVEVKHVEARAQSSSKPQKGRTCEVELSAESQKCHPGAGRSFKPECFSFSWTEGIPSFVVSVSCILARPDPPLTTCQLNRRILKAPPAQYNPKASKSMKILSTPAVWCICACSAIRKQFKCCTSALSTVYLRPESFKHLG